ncbi:uncharacterized protein FFB20_12299 [Fusarium fujikuroi]|uniref:BHLH domain-containing protein n=1 Tax=Fusarium fujikuroi TaxID=5127 RepID=A0A9Q9RRJ8_FUSFU|nr:Uncharacterized protein LW94_4999 [Fusarium fujikuroi]SCN92003.1 uncharacterized protein FFE2_07255 [Fusarium fujikuroi]SCO05333.1 uncharacterized protein FFB20_12299 [Fusarium fujikuroi]SCO43116.1 uncharacterized protein FFMR_07217 [Fusarium fujikuroi]SCV31861.1 uncharacterized protein FFFS_03016 [Fusarium fujikuroi]
MPPMSINDTKHLLTLTNQMPLGLVTEQVTAQNLPWNVDEYSSSEYFSNTSSSPELADHAQACYPFNYLTNSTTPPNHDVNMISPTEHSSARERQIRSPTQMIQVPQMTETQLRVASRKPKNRRYKVTSNTPAHVRECHHLAEKQYRTRLKAQFESLLAALPASRTNTLADRDSTPSSGQVLSRGQVLDLARERILELEEEVRITGGILSNVYPLA